MRSYVYRCHPPESTSRERCISLSWCSGCRIYTGTMVHVPRKEALPDALAALPLDEQDRLRRSEVRLISYLERRTGDETP
ncbi:hypothetical protein AB0L00_25060 [Actinoallomurus sp. NPDC052308]|uniref:hypothetical protein n=1 Tax=Actinoallomurus sp. NPDC052308 TaxID=3155530 RepID=UPI0034346269